MLVGVRFCGGCNPRFNRGEALEKIKKNNPSVTFENAEEGKEYNNLLVIGGCTNCCADHSYYISKGEIIKFWDEEDIDRIIEKINIEKCKI